MSSCADAAIAFKRPRGTYHPVWNVVLTVAMPLIMSVYVGIAEKAAQLAIGHIRRQKSAKPQMADLIGAMNNDLVAAEIQLNDMLRIAENYEFEAVDQNGQDILTRKTNVANAAIGVVTKAMEIAGGAGFYRSFGLERLFRDIQAARYHPLPENEQVKFSGEYPIAGLTQVARAAGRLGRSVLASRLPPGHVASLMEAPRGGGGSFFDSGQRAKIVRLDAEDRVELAAKVLECDHRGQFD